MSPRRPAGVGLAGVVLVGALAGCGRAADPVQVTGVERVLLIRIVGVGFPAVVDDPGLRRIAASGGVAMLRGPDATVETLRSLERSDRVDAVAASVSEALEVVGAQGGPSIPVAVVALSGDRGVPDSLVWATSSELAAGAPGPTPRSLTSDSTRRVGIVTPDDLAATVADAIDDPSIDVGDGSPIEVVDAPPPVDLYERYLDYRALATPVQAGVAVWWLSVGIWALWAIRRGRGRRAALVAVLSLPVLFLSLLLVGHLPSLTPATVLPALAIASLAGGGALMRVAERAGVGTALAWAGGIALAGLVVESLLGWTAAFAPMLGGSHLDGARFHGMPNAEIGLAIAGALLVAHRLRPTAWGVGLLAATSLWAGAPWLGANLGAAVAAAAAAGLWWGIAGNRGALPTAAAAAATATLGAAVTIGLHRLDPRATHVTRATTGMDVVGLLDAVGRRLGIGARLIAEQPAAAIPVLGTVAALVALARPPRALARGLAAAARSREAALAIAWSSLVAYVANDTGAAALGLGFGLLAVTLVAVSLAAAPGKMDR